MALSSTRLVFLGFSNLVLSQAVQCIYPHGECYELKLQKCNGSTSWTLHGLWPEWQNECEGPDFDENVLKDIHDEMEKNGLLVQNMESLNRNSGVTSGKNMGHALEWDSWSISRRPCRCVMST